MTEDFHTLPAIEKKKLFVRRRVTDNLVECEWNFSDEITTQSVVKPYLVTFFLNKIFGEEEWLIGQFRE